MKHTFLRTVRVLIALGLLVVPSSSFSFAQGIGQGTIPVGPPPAGSDGLVVVFNFESSCQSVEMMIVDAPHEREGERTCATEPNSNFIPGVGDGIQATFTVHNTSNHPIVMKAIRLGGRGPGGRAQNWNAPNADWPANTNITVKPDGYYEYSRLQYFNGAPGDYFGEPVFQDTAGAWHGISPFPRIWFNLGGSSPPPPPTGGGTEIFYDTAGWLPWASACTGNPPSACFPLKVNLTYLPNEKWKSAARSAINGWNLLGTKAQMVEDSNIPN